MLYLAIFGLELEKIIIIFEINALEFVYCKISWEKENA